MAEKLNLFWRISDLGLDLEARLHLGYWIEGWIYHVILPDDGE